MQISVNTALEFFLQLFLSFLHRKLTCGDQIIFLNVIFLCHLKHTSVQSSAGFLSDFVIGLPLLPSDLHSLGFETGPYQDVKDGILGNILLRLVSNPLNEKIKIKEQMRSLVQIDCILMTICKDCA